MTDKIFKAHPNLERYFKTADGQAFFTESAAKNHARSLTDKTVTPVNRHDAEIAEPKSVAKEYEMNAANTVKAVKAANTLEELDAFKDDDRKTVINAVAERRAELEALATNDDDDDDAKKAAGIEVKADTVTGSQEPAKTE